MATRMEIGPYSAYAIAVAAGFKGSEEEWLKSLIGPQGQKGETGDIGPRGIQGEQGPQGASITGAELDENGHLMVTIYDPADEGTKTVDAGAVGTSAAVTAALQQIQTAGTNAVQTVNETGEGILSGAQEAASAASRSAQNAVLSAQTAGAAAESAGAAASAAEEAAEVASAAQEAAQQARQGAETAQEAAETAAVEAVSAAGELDASVIVAEASGDVIQVDDSAEAKLRGLKLYGRSVQDGVPTPENPVEIQSMGDGGNVGVKIQGKNLIYTASMTSSNGVTMTENEDGTFTLNGTVVNANAGLYFVGNYNTTNVTYPDAQYSFKVDGLQESDRLIIRNNSRDEFNARFNAVLSYNGNIAQVGIILIVGHTYDNTIIKPMLIAGDNMPDEFIPGVEPQTLTYLTPNGLPGIPVESGGNYTDENGQQWICDEVDFGRGKYVQRVRIRTVESTDNIQINTGASDEDVNRCFLKCPGKLQQKIGVRCNVLTYSKDYLYNNMPAKYLVDEASENVLFGVEKSFGSTSSIIRQNLMDAGAKMLYALATPIETDLTTEQKEAYAKLTTYKPNTTVCVAETPVGGDIRLSYVADTKSYIDRKFDLLKELQAQVDALIGAES